MKYIDPDEQAKMHERAKRGAEGWKNAFKTEAQKADELAALKIDEDRQASKHAAERARADDAITRQEKKQAQDFARLERARKEKIAEREYRQATKDDNTAIRKEVAALRAEVKKITSRAAQKALKKAEKDMRKSVTALNKHILRIINVLTPQVESMLQPKRSRGLSDVPARSKATARPRNDSK